MYHLFHTQQSRNCVFVYDDSDGSVEYTEICNLNKLSGQFGESMQFSSTDFPFAKLRMLAWVQSDGGSSLSFNLLAYKIGGVTIGIKLIVDTRNGHLDTLFIFTEEKVNLSSLVNYSRKYNITLSSSAFDYISRSDNEYVSPNIIKMSCPTVMISWLLHLRSVRDFDGIMQAFDNLFGKDINKIVANAPRGSISFKR